MQGEKQTMGTHEPAHSLATFPCTAACAPWLPNLGAWAAGGTCSFFSGSRWWTSTMLVRQRIPCCPAPHLTMTRTALACWAQARKFQNLGLSLRCCRLSGCRWQVAGLRSRDLSRICEDPFLCRGCPRLTVRIAEVAAARRCCNTISCHVSPCGRHGALSTPQPNGSAYAYAERSL